MNIDELKIKQGNVELKAVVIDKQEVREWNKMGRSGKVCNAIIQDDTGAVAMTLWNDDCDKVQLGDIIHITNGYCGEYKGDKQVSTGRNGKLEIVGKKEVEPLPDEEEDNGQEDNSFTEEELESLDEEDVEGL